MVDVTDESTIRGHIEIRVWDVDELEGADPDWPDRSRDERRAILQDPSDYPTAPIEEIETTNIPVDGYLEALASGDNPQPTHLALGNDATSPSGTNTSLNNEVYRTIVGADEQNGRERITSTLLSQNEANGYTISELGFTDGWEDEDWTLLTHAALDSAQQVDKNSSISVTINYTLSWQRVS